jgi:hypothetical protein
MVVFSAFVGCQATLTRVTRVRKRIPAVCLPRQMMYRRIMLPCSLWLAWSVPSSVK